MLPGGRVAGLNLEDDHVGKIGTIYLKAITPRLVRLVNRRASATSLGHRPVAGPTFPWRS